MKDGELMEMEISRDELIAHLEEEGFGSFRGDGRTTCPSCGPNRKKSDDKCLSVNESEDGDGYLYHCHHCLIAGKVSLDMTEPNAATDFEVSLPAGVVVPLEEYGSLSEQQLAWLAGRGISMSTAMDAGLINGMIWIRARNAKVPCIGFPYENDDGSTAIKWRDGAKNFTQIGAARSLWKIEEFEGGDLIITEGEMDALAFRQCGIAAYSVPNGAPSTALKNDDGHSKKYAYLWSARDIIAKASRVIIAGDIDDGPGEILIEELARRVGRAKSWKVVYPDGLKDANEVLIAHGPEGLKAVLESATPWPIGGLRNASEYKSEALSIWKDGASRGVDIPVGMIQNYYRPSLGTLTICTGVPGSGKSTFLTWMSYILAKQEGWKTAVFSAETSSPVHLLQLASLHAGKPFHGDDKMDQSTMEDSIDWVNDNYVFLDESETSIDSVIERASAAVLRHGVRVLYVDPYNFITMDRPAEGDNQQHGINSLLVKLKSFAVEHDVAVWLVAHPTKMYRDAQGNTPIPGGYDISGSAHFFNVADSGITISRDKTKPGVSKMTSWKARFSWLGQVGWCDLGFNIGDGSFETLKEWGDSPSDYDL
jgi:twinkle protein